MTRHEALVLFGCSILLLLSTVNGASLGINQTLAEQTFEWQTAFASRSQGTYSQYEANLAAGAQYKIFTSNPHGGTTQDTYLYLLDSALRVVALDDDSNANYQAAITYTPTEAGLFYIRLRSYTRGRTGLCSISLSRPTVAPVSAVVVLRAGDVLYDQDFAWDNTFTSRPDGNYASYKLAATRGIQYTLATSDPRSTEPDTFLYLYNPAGVLVASDDDSNGNLMSRIIHTASDSGNYTVKLRAYTRGVTGKCTVTCTSSQPSASSPLLPDLITWEDYLHDVDMVTVNATKRLRFSNAPTNIGQGPMDLYGIVERDGTTTAYQRVWNTDGSSTVYLAGTFSFAGHQDHNHWHFDDFADYKLRAVNPDGTAGTSVATSAKVTFCLEDVSAYDLTMPKASQRAFFTCDRQGISVGWADLYAKALTGQDIDVTNVADGTYFLESTVDPRNRLRELNDNNNVASIKIRFVKATNSVQVVS
jgi:hypothetical protein